MIKYMIRLSTVVVLVLIVPVAWATPMAPGVTSLASAEPDPVGGAVVAGPLVTPMVGAAFNCTVTSTVILGDVTNPLGGLTFVYQVANNPTSLDAIGRVTLTGYAGWLTDMSFQAAPLGAAPTLMDRSASGDAAGYSFIAVPLGAGVLSPGATSKLLVVQTNAPAWGVATGNVINGSVASGPIYAPVPEPAAMLLLLAGLGWVMRRR